MTVASDSDSKDMQRMRQFYANKIEDMQQRHAAEKRAWKRGEEQQQQTSVIVSRADERLELLTRRNAQLEEELMGAVQQVGLLRAQLSSVPGQKDAPDEVKTGSRAVLLDVVQGELARSREQVELVTSEMQLLADARIQQLRDLHKLELDRHAAQCLADKELLLGQLRAAEERYASVVALSSSSMAEQKPLSCTAHDIMVSSVLLLSAIS